MMLRRTGKTSNCLFYMTKKSIRRKLSLFKDYLGEKGEIQIQPQQERIQNHLWEKI